MYVDEIHDGIQGPRDSLKLDVSRWLAGVVSPGVRLWLGSWPGDSALLPLLGL